MKKKILFISRLISTYQLQKKKKLFCFFLIPMSPFVYGVEGCRLRVERGFPSLVRAAAGPPAAAPPSQQGTSDSEPGQFQPTNSIPMAYHQTPAALERQYYSDEEDDFYEQGVESASLISRQACLVVPRLTTQSFIHFRVPRSPMRKSPLV